jgi:putative toxin-antitoxin system antitoxin component (TIGR02293 family)
MIRAGVRASYAKRIAADLRLDQRVVFNALNLKTATVNRKASARAALAPDEGERVLGMAKLLGQVEAMLQGADLPPGFKAVEWLARWLSEPLPAFGGIKPLDMLDTLEGQSLVAQALAQIEAGAYA